MDACVESALLSSLIAWSSANRMAAMGERLLYDGICPGNCFSFGIELENRWLVEMFSSRCAEHAQAFWWWFLWFECHLALVPFLAEYEAFWHGFTFRIILLATKISIILHLSRVKCIPEISQRCILKKSSVGLLWDWPMLCFCAWWNVDIYSVIPSIELLFRDSPPKKLLCRDIFVLPRQIYFCLYSNLDTKQPAARESQNCLCNFLKASCLYGCASVCCFFFFKKKTIFLRAALFCVGYEHVFLVNGSLITVDILPAEQHPTVISDFSRPL